METLPNLEPETKTEAQAIDTPKSIENLTQLEVILYNKARQLGIKHRLMPAEYLDNFKIFLVESVECCICTKRASDSIVPIIIQFEPELLWGYITAQETWDSIKRILKSVPELSQPISVINNDSNIILKKTPYNTKWVKEKYKQDEKEVIKMLPSNWRISCKRHIVSTYTDVVTGHSITIEENENITENLSNSWPLKVRVELAKSLKTLESEVVVKEGIIDDMDGEAL